MSQKTLKCRFRGIARLTSFIFDETSAHLNAIYTSNHFAPPKPGGSHNLKTQPQHLFGKIKRFLLFNKI
jgi:hypothetical protein